MSTFDDNDAVIASIVRTPIGRAGKGRLVGIRPDDLAAQAFAAAIDRVPGLDSEEVEDLYLGCAEPDREQGENIARRVAVQLGRDDVPGATVNRFCSSSLLATRMAFHGIRAGEGDVYLVGGVESISRYGEPAPARNPLFDAPSARAQTIIASGQDWQDPRSDGALPDVYLAMGLTAELVARTTGTTRRDQDEYALLSQMRTKAAIESGFFAREIVPVTLPNGETVNTDDSPRPGTTADGLAGLDPIFVTNGTVTAGNACPLNDGASAAVVLSGRAARRLGATPIARIVAGAATALSPEIMGLGPVAASRRALDRAALTMNDLDIVEINEAFAAQVVPSARQLGIPYDKLNPHGGAIALGHPYGATGVRMLATLLNGLEAVDGQYGMASLCVGGGQGMALVVERL